MIAIRSKSMRVLVLLVFAIILAAATYGFAAANTFSGGSTVGRMGEGSGAISGYDVTSVSFTLNSANPHQITAVALVLDNSATGVQVSLDGATWDTCSGSGVNWSCTLGSAVNVSAANSLDVYATDL
ncbi:MAG: hypothetical protein ISR58_17365 [Anaerolineales bacterium]|nr:hypothetical protein [Chloroflexota bacterium]MBL6982946.1 hypothetical protein [Anaerolineales bacterium]